MLARPERQPRLRSARMSCVTITRYFKNIRNKAVDAYFKSRGRTGAISLLTRLAGSSDTCIFFTIAFNSPWVIDIITYAWARNVANAKLVVVDNSSLKGHRERIRDICARRNVEYLALPKNPEWNPNRSHGIAMNWVFYNIVRHLRPDTFGFIDHDCIPVAPIDFSARMMGKKLYGQELRSMRFDDAWYLWAGLCLYRYAVVDGLELDFKHQVEAGMDTGGSNWQALYRNISKQDAMLVTNEIVDITMNGQPTAQQFLDGVFLHIGGASYAKKFTSAEGREIISSYIWNTYLDPEGSRTGMPDYGTS